jgi:hypothetical protein
VTHRPPPTLHSRICNAAYRGDCKTLGYLLETARKERRAADAAEREAEEAARLAKENEEWQVIDNKGNRIKKKTKQLSHRLTPAQMLAEQEENKREWELKVAHDQAEREAREHERMLRPPLWDVAGKCQFQWGQEGVRVVMVGVGKYEFRLDTMGMASACFEPRPPRLSVFDADRLRFVHVRMACPVRCGRTSAVLRVHDRPARSVACAAGGRRSHSRHHLFALAVATRQRPVQPGAHHHSAKPGRFRHCTGRRISQVHNRHCVGCGVGERTSRLCGGGECRAPRVPGVWWARHRLCAHVIATRQPASGR